MRLQDSITSKLKKHAFGGEETYRFLMSLATNIFVIVVHFALLLFFVVGDSQIVAAGDYDGRVMGELFVYLNIFALALFGASFALIFYRKYFAYGALLALEVCGYTVVFCLFFGLSSYVVVYVVLLAILQVMMPSTKRLAKELKLTLSALSIIFCLVISSLFEPLLALSKTLLICMTAINITIFLSGAIIQFWLSRLAAKIAVEIGKNRISTLSIEAQTDELTGAFNRRYAKKFFELADLSQTTYCLAMLDIDDFKNVNDTYGHNCGDEVLKFLADFIGQNLRVSDILVRWGGEEFLIILTDIDAEMAFEVMDELRELLGLEIVKTKESDLAITVTIGIATLTQSFDESIKACDKKMYEGKRRGKNVVVV